MRQEDEKVLPLKDKNGKIIGSGKILDNGNAVLLVNPEFQAHFPATQVQSISTGYEVLLPDGKNSWASLVVDKTRL